MDSEKCRMYGTTTTALQVSGSGVEVGRPGQRDTTSKDTMIISWCMSFPVMKEANSVEFLTCDGDLPTRVDKMET